MADDQTTPESPAEDAATDTPSLEPEVEAAASASEPKPKAKAKETTPPKAGATPDETQPPERPKRQKSEQTEAGGTRIRIRLKAYDHKVIDQSAHQIIDTAERTGAVISGPIPLPTEKSRYTVIRGPHVHKDSREAFEMRIHKRLIDITQPTPRTVDALMNMNLPAGVDIEIKM